MFLGIFEVHNCQSNPPFGELSFFLIKNLVGDAKEMLKVVLKDLKFHKQSFELNEYDKDTSGRKTKKQ